ncbi:MAG TPA: glycerol-3-phosphate 1-O-acyltransferase PlsB [Burkholderiaceae bacterium]|nr:glycerol-3-phosphate 1-O-acyltransferase PlsB [Burkholderiaceae bacterium]
MTLSPVSRAAQELARSALRRLVRATVVAPQAAGEAIDRGRPVCYALPFRQLSALLVLEDEAQRLGLPSPRAPLATDAVHEDGAYFFLTASGQPSPLRRQPYRYAPRLERLVAAVRANPELDVQIVPVHVFWGRAPAKQESIVKALLADSWVVPGTLRQALRIAVHGRQTLLKFGEPIPLGAIVRGSDEPGLALRRIARLLRAEFRRERERVIGPDLSHRHTLVNAVIDSERVQQAIGEQALARNIAREQIERTARRHAYAIASDYSYPFQRAFELALNRLWNRLYDGIEVHRFEDARAAADGATLVYLPCHRSHIDYLLLSYLIWRQGLPPPHVAAGDNLNLPVVGSLLRRGGAFFLRRSFKGDPLYAAVFAEYLHAMIARGFAIEFFVEAGRSRTGRTLPPKSGLLAMTVESWQREPRRPLVFVPVYIGYEKLLEGNSYIAELSGRPKQRESLPGLLLSLRRLREHFGRVHVNMGEPIRIDTWFDPATAEPAPRERIAELATEVVSRINDAAVVNAVNLVSVAMLATPRHAMDAAQLARQIDLLRRLLERVPYSARLALTPLDGEQAVAYAERTGLLARIPHPLGDVLQVPQAQAALLAYFRNNVLHAFAVPALIACVIAQGRSDSRDALLAVVQRLFPFLRAELFLSWPPERLPQRVDDYLQAFDALQLTRADALAPPPAGTPESVALHSLAQVMRQPLERYFITLAVLTGQGPGALTPQAAEDLCYLLAQRMSFLHETGSPEFFDRAAFRSIIEALEQLGLVRRTEGRLHFDERLAACAADAEHLLSAEVRLAIAHVTQLRGEDVARAEQALRSA